MIRRTTTAFFESTPVVTPTMRAVLADFPNIKVAGKQYEVVTNERDLLEKSAVFWASIGLQRELIIHDPELEEWKRWQEEVLSSIHKTDFESFLRSLNQKVWESFQDKPPSEQTIADFLQDKPKHKFGNGREVAIMTTSDILLHKSAYC